MTTTIQKGTTMSMFGLDGAEITGLVRTVAPNPDSGSVQEVFARASWTGIAEPGDRAAGELVATLGAAGALTVLVESWPVKRIADAASAGGSDLAAADIESALARWSPRLKSGVALVALRQAVRFAVRLLVPGDPAWPVGVDDLGAHAPIALWLRGNESTLAAAKRSYREAAMFHTAEFPKRKAPIGVSSRNGINYTLSRFCALGWRSWGSVFRFSGRLRGSASRGSGALKRERAQSTQGEFSIIFQTVKNCRDVLFARNTPNSMKYQW